MNWAPALNMKRERPQSTTAATKTSLGTLVVSSAFCRGLVWVGGWVDGKEGEIAAFERGAGVYRWVGGGWVGGTDLQYLDLVEVLGELGQRALGHCHELVELLLGLGGRGEVGGWVGGWVIGWRGPCRCRLMEEDASVCPLPPSTTTPCAGRPGHVRQERWVTGGCVWVCGEGRRRGWVGWLVCVMRLLLLPPSSSSSSLPWPGAPPWGEGQPSCCVRACCGW